MFWNTSSVSPTFSNSFFHSDMSVFAIPLSPFKRGKSALYMGFSASHERTIYYYSPLKACSALDRLVPALSGPSAVVLVEHQNHSSDDDGFIPVKVSDLERMLALLSRLENRDIREG